MDEGATIAYGTHFLALLSVDNKALWQHKQFIVTRACKEGGREGLEEAATGMITWYSICFSADCLLPKNN